MNIPVFDFHCDTALAMLGENMNSVGSLRSNPHHIDLDRASSLAGYAQCFACFTTSIAECMGPVSPVVAFERELATILREVEQNSDRISLAYSAKQIEENRRKGMMSASGKLPDDRQWRKFHRILSQRIGSDLPGGQSRPYPLRTLVRVQLSPPKRKPLKINGFFFYIFTSECSAPGCSSSI